MPDAAPTTRTAHGPGGRRRPRWRRELAEAIRDPGELCRVLGLDERVADEARRAAGGFPLLVPRAFAARMRHGDAADPLLRQVLPQGPEMDDVAGFTADPVGESQALAAPGLVRKYAGRALLLATGACAVNCRYCFRREFPYAAAGASRAGLEAALAAIAADPGLHEVILSGGDPLLLDDDPLIDLVGRIAAIGHVRRLRIHTRLPIVIPARVTARLAASLAATRPRVVVVLHANHPAELDGTVARAVRRLARARVVILNQSVLLAGVNDDVSVLRELSERLVDVGVTPYYLHVLDRVRGAAHFDVAESRAQDLHRRLSASLPGYAVPRLVREVAGEPAKVVIA